MTREQKSQRSRSSEKRKNNSTVITDQIEFIDQELGFDIGILIIEENYNRGSEVRGTPGTVESKGGAVR